MHPRAWYGAGMEQAALCTCCVEPSRDSEDLSTLAQGYVPELPESSFTTTIPSRIKLFISSYALFVP